jgi:manganese/zinc/iron transport system substrate-binding protein
MEPNGKVKILCTTSQVGDMVRGIAPEERVDVLVLIEGDLDPHSYELAKGDDEKFQRADLIVYNGLGLEHGASVAALLATSPCAFSVGDAIREKAPGSLIHRGGAIDPHVWMDISLFAEAIGPVAHRLAAHDPEGKEAYVARAKALEESWKGADRELIELLRQVPENRRYLVTSHDAFHYFTRRYLAEEGEEGWEERFRAPEGLAPDGQLNPADLRRVVDFVEARQIGVLFPESNVNRDSIEKIASAAAERGLAVALSEKTLYGDSTGSKSYLEMMRYNGQTLAEELAR